MRTLLFLLLTCLTSFGAGYRIRDLPNTNSVTGPEVFELDDGTKSWKITAYNLVGNFLAKNGGYGTNLWITNFIFLDGIATHLVVQQDSVYTNSLEVAGISDFVGTVKVNGGVSLSGTTAIMADALANSQILVTDTNHTIVSSGYSLNTYSNAIRNSISQTNNYTTTFITNLYSSTNINDYTYTTNLYSSTNFNSYTFVTNEITAKTAYITNLTVVSSLNSPQLTNMIWMMESTNDLSGSASNVVVNMSVPGLEVTVTNNITLTNFTGLLVGLTKTKVIYLQVTVGGPWTVTYPTDGISYGLYWSTNCLPQANRPYTSVTNGSTYILSLTSRGTNVYSAMTEWK